MAQGTISKRAVEALPTTGKTHYLWDTDPKGFGVRVTPAGAKSYLFSYRMGGRGSPVKRVTIGAVGKLTPDQARQRAKDLAHRVAIGVDPVASEKEAAQKAMEKARREGELLFENIAARWLETYELHHRPRTIEQARHIVLGRMLPALQGRPIDGITRTDIQRIIDDIPIQHSASRLAVYSYASVLFRWAMERGDITDNPVRLMAKPTAPKARDRVLNDDELALIWRASGTLDYPFGPMVRILILTGQRREEVAALDWAELDRKAATWTLPAGRAKNDSAHVVPLTDAVMTELDALAQLKGRESWPRHGLVFTTTGNTPVSGYSKAKARLDRAMIEEKTGGDNRDKTALPAIEPWRLHDLRRTLATGLQRLGIRLEVTEAVLNHRSGSRGGIVGVYQRHDWADEKRAALAAWARQVEGILAPKDETNVTPMFGRAG